MHKQKGFTLIEVMLCLLVICMIGLIGLYAWSKGNGSKLKETNSASTQNTQSTTSSTEKKKLGSVNCNQLNTAASINSGHDDELVKKLESSAQFAIIMANYTEIAKYETYLGSECKLNNETSIISFSHYVEKYDSGGIANNVYTKGVAIYDGSNIIYVDTNSPCEDGPPDATAPASINSVQDDLVSITCGGYSAKKVKFDLNTKSYLVN